MTLPITPNVPALYGPKWPRLSSDAHKYDRGHAMVLSGPSLSTGASRLAAIAALRAGAGLVSLVGEREALAEHACHVTAIMLREAGTGEAVLALGRDRRARSIVVGPGGGLSPHRQALQRDVATGALRQNMALVLDADGLTAFTGLLPRLAHDVTRAAVPAVLTPHEGEFARLFPDLAGERADRACMAARQTGAVVVLKGPQTLIAGPDGRCAMQKDAPRFLATAGSGDVLAGIILGLLAQRMSGFEAACAAVAIHVEAGRLAGDNCTADDIAACVSRATTRIAQGAGEASGGSKSEGSNR